MSIEALRQELHRQKEAFDQALQQESADRRASDQPPLDHVQRLAKWEAFLAQVRPLSIRLAHAEKQSALDARRKVRAIRHYESGARV